jgi:hypothetical protein
MHGDSFWIVEGLLRGIDSGNPLSGWIYAQIQKMPGDAPETAFCAKTGLTAGEKPPTH